MKTWKHFVDRSPDEQDCHNNGERDQQGCSSNSHYSAKSYWKDNYAFSSTWSSWQAAHNLTNVSQQKLKK